MGNGLSYHGVVFLLCPLISHSVAFGKGRLFSVISSSSSSLLPTAPLFLGDLSLRIHPMLYISIRSAIRLSFVNTFISLLRSRGGSFRVSRGGPKVKNFTRTLYLVALSVKLLRGAYAFVGKSDVSSRQTYLPLTLTVGIFRFIMHTCQLQCMKGREIKMTIHQKTDEVDGTKAEEAAQYFESKKLHLTTTRTCECASSHINCMTAKEWIKCQMGVWEFFYEGRDIRDKNKHPATFPIALARRCIDLFSHQGELIVDPFMGSGTTLVAARDANINAVGFDIKPEYIALTQERLAQDTLFAQTQQIPILDDARHIAAYLD